jgi:D-3-phosphoglycerate dehydrogenase
MFLCTDKFFLESSAIKPLVFSEDLAAFSHKEAIQGIIVRLGVHLSESLLKKFPQLKFVATITTGLDHIDLNFCERKSIQVISLKGETAFLTGIRATPEHTWGLLLSLLRNTSSAHNDVLLGHWRRESFFGHELNGKTLGIIGLGRVGSILSGYAHAFGMKILAYDKEFRDVPNVTMVELDELLGSAEVISLNLPYEKATESFINQKLFMKMMKKPWVVNTARGGIIEEDDLIVALKSGQIKGYATDVLAGEVSFEGKAKSKLVDYAAKNSHVVITPHIAGSTYESMVKTAKFLESKICHLIT